MLDTFNDELLAAQEDAIKVLRQIAVKETGNSPEGLKQRVTAAIALTNIDPRHPGLVKALEEAEVA